jgi:hypothetical protein
MAESLKTTEDDAARRKDESLKAMRGVGRSEWTGQMP